MRVIIQSRVVQVIQPEIVEYICDDCGAVCGTKENPKEEYFKSTLGRNIHFCKHGCECDK